MMIDVIFTDTHFGWKNNSMTWLNSQLNFIYKQFIPKIKELSKINDVRVIHCGDVFDSRSTISTYVATKVVKAFADIRANCKEFIILCGNHDFYSPNDDTINTVSLFMNNMNIDIVSQEVLERDGHAYIPWYKWIDRDNIDITEGFVFCHGDILNETLPEWARGRTIFSGHIHTPGEKPGLFNLGSCYSLNFADSNSDRGFYIIKDGKISFIKNEVSIKFYRLYNDEILNKNIKDMNADDYIELYVTETNMSKESYVNSIKKYTERFSHLWIIPQVTEHTGTIDENFKGYDIEAIMEGMIPDDLTVFYSKVKNHLKMT